MEKPIVASIRVKLVDLLLALMMKIRAYESKALQWQIYVVFPQNCTLIRGSLTNQRPEFVITFLLYNTHYCIFIVYLIISTLMVFKIFDFLTQGA